MWISCREKGRAIRRVRSVSLQANLHQFSAFVFQGTYQAIKKIVSFMMDRVGSASSAVREGLLKADLLIVMGDKKRDSLG